MGSLRSITTGSKTSVGDYSYGTKPHAVTGVTNPEDLISSITQRITYTSFNKADSIIEGNHIYTLTYGFDNQRTMSKLFNNGTLQKTVYYAGNYEREDISGTYPRHIHYIYGGDGLAAIYTSQYSEQNMQYVHKDHLGSLDKVTNSSGSVIQSTSFDAWGRRRNPSNWTYTSIPLATFSRGYTGHEHLDLFSLINMNGRMYDPILGRFLSPDNFVQASDFTQSYNRYSYCLNNPLIYTDPDGEFIFTAICLLVPGLQPLLPIAIGADIGAVTGGIRGAMDSDVGFWKGAGRGALVGGIGGGLSMIGGAGMPFTTNLLLGTAEGAITGGLDAALWGNDIGNGECYGELQEELYLPLLPRKI